MNAPVRPVCDVCQCEIGRVINTHAGAVIVLECGTVKLWPKDAIMHNDTAATETLNRCDSRTEGQ